MCGELAHLQTLHTAADSSGNNSQSGVSLGPEAAHLVLLDLWLGVCGSPEGSSQAAFSRLVCLCGLPLVNMDPPFKRRSHGTLRLDVRNETMTACFIFSFQSRARGQTELRGGGVTRLFISLCFSLFTF